ncbi:hypothetical protein [Mucilaginibacter sp. dw_454]|uniref:hypothetical protein n=1 Tax=Mucilaginibacter sp. dw_454 TaxID=2720079 RepID=UPI001BD58F7C|nr:hypothetical protein [Mucilaginibacter sp. dw_454]
MRSSVKYFCLLLAITVIYAACKKSDSGPNSIFNPAELSRELAVSLYKSLSGQYGGANISDGIKAPLSISTPAHRGPQINDVNPYCGLTIDTAYNLSQDVIDTVKTYYTRFKFVYGCENNVLNSYSLQDSIANTLTAPAFKAVYKLTQLYNVKAIDQTYKVSAVQGIIYFSSHIDATKQSIAQYEYMDSYYNLQGIKVDISSGTADVVAGTSTITAIFQYKDATNNITDNITGSIEFLGIHMSRVTLHISGDNTTYIYLVNMLSGQVTAQ